MKVLIVYEGAEYEGIVTGDLGAEELANEVAECLSKGAAMRFGVEGGHVVFGPEAVRRLVVEVTA